MPLQKKKGCPLCLQQPATLNPLFLDCYWSPGMLPFSALDLIFSQWLP